MSRAVLIPEPWVELSPAPWWCAADNGVVYDAEDTPICVLGDPNADLDEQAIRNGAVIVAAPAMLAALKGLHAVRPANWADEEDPEHAAAWAALDAAVLLAEPAGETSMQILSARTEPHPAPVNMFETAYDPALDAAEQVP